MFLDFDPESERLLVTQIPGKLREVNFEIRGKYNHFAGIQQKNEL